MSKESEETPKPAAEEATPAPAETPKTETAKPKAKATEAPAAEVKPAEATEEKAEKEVKPKAAKTTKAKAKKSDEPAKTETAEAEAKPEKKAAAQKETAPKAETKTAGKSAKPEAKSSDSENKDISLSLDEIEKPKIIRAKGSKNVTNGIAHVQASFNNTIVTITDERGGVLGWSSAGKMGFKGSRKSTAYAAQIVAQDACRQAMGHGLKEVEARIKGPGAGRESAVRAMQAIGLDVSVIRDVTPVPHNGCRPPKQRRV
ncbi:MAG: 30S ribosomal protein S11 [Chthoniobacterales bacterium]